MSLSLLLGCLVALAAEATSDLVNIVCAVVPAVLAGENLNDLLRRIVADQAEQDDRSVLLAQQFELGLNDLTVANRVVAFILSAGLVLLAAVGGFVVERL